MVFNLFFANSTILSCLSLFFLITDLYFLIPAVVIQIFSPASELAMPILIPTKEAKAKNETHPVIA